MLMMSSLFNFGEQLKKALIDKRVKPSELAAKLNVTHSQVCNLMRSNSVNTTTLCRVCDALEMKVGEFVDE